MNCPAMTGARVAVARKTGYFTIITHWQWQISSTTTITRPKISYIITVKIGGQIIFWPVRGRWWEKCAGVDNKLN